MSSTLTVRFIGSYLFVLDTSTGLPKAKLYLRASDCRGHGPHTPKVTFNPAYLDKEYFTGTEILQVTTKCDQLASRRIPEGAKLNFELSAVTIGLTLERAKVPTDQLNEGLRIELLPRLASGGARSLLLPEHLTRLSSAELSFGDMGYISCEKVGRGEGNVPILWKFLDLNNGEHNPNDQQYIAEVLNWKVALTNDTVILRNDNDIFLKLSSKASTDFEITISNLSEAAVERTDNDRLEDFIYLLDYADDRDRVRMPVIVDVPSTGGSALCPGARWP